MIPNAAKKQKFSIADFVNTSFVFLPNMNDGFPQIFSNQLYAIDEAAAGENSKKLPQKPILILVTEMSNSEKTFLLKMMGASKLEAEQYHIIEFGESALPFRQIQNNGAFKIVINFGVRMSQLCITAQLPVGHVQRFSEKLWLAMPTLSEIEKNETYKKHVWSQMLKPVFIEKKYQHFLKK